MVTITTLNGAANWGDLESKADQTAVNTRMLFIWFWNNINTTWFSNVRYHQSPLSGRGRIASVSELYELDVLLKVYDAVLHTQKWQRWLFFSRCDLKIMFESTSERRDAPNGYFRCDQQKLCQILRIIRVVLCV